MLADDFRLRELTRSKGTRSTAEQCCETPTRHKSVYHLSTRFLGRLPFFKGDIVHGTDHPMQTLLLLGRSVEGVQTAAFRFGKNAFRYLL